MILSVWTDLLYFANHGIYDNNGVWFLKDSALLNESESKIHPFINAELHTSVLLLLLQHIFMVEIVIVCTQITGFIPERIDHFKLIG